MSTQPQAPLYLPPKTELEAYALASSLEQAKALEAKARPILEQARAIANRACRLVLEAQGYELSGSEEAFLGELDGKPVVVVRGDPAEKPELERGIPTIGNIDPEKQAAEVARIMAERETARGAEAELEEPSS